MTAALLKPLPLAALLLQCRDQLTCEGAQLLAGHWPISSGLRGPKTSTPLADRDLADSVARRPPPGPRPGAGNGASTLIGS